MSHPRTEQRENLERDGLGIGSSGRILGRPVRAIHRQRNRYRCDRNPSGLPVTVPTYPAGMSARPYRESFTADAGSSFHVMARRLARYPYNLHYHEQFELIVHHQGTGTVFLGEHVGPYVTPAVTLVGRDLPHTWVIEGDGSGRPLACDVIHFPASLLESLTTLPEGAALGRLLQRAGGGLVLAGPAGGRVIARLAGFTEADGTGRLLRLLAALDEFITCEPAPLSGPVPLAANERGGLRIRRICRWLTEHLDDDITLARVAATEGLHPQALARFFRRHTSHSLIGYLHRLRVSRACALLRDSDRSVLQVCFASGFGNLPHFNRIFRRVTGLTPSTWRQRLGG